MLFKDFDSENEYAAGTALAEHLIKKDADYPLEVVALVGICIKDFVNFIFCDISLKQLK